MHYSKTKNFFIYIYFLLFIIFLCASEISAQDDIIQIKSDCVISAAATNLFPMLNETVNIKVQFKSTGESKQGGFSLYYELDDAVLVSGSRRYEGDITKGQIITMEVNVKFSQKRTYNINLVLSSLHRMPLVKFTFYVDGAFRESWEVKALRETIARQKDIINKTKNSKDEDAPYYSTSTYDAYVTTTNITPLNKYEEKNIKILEQKNIELFKTLKNEFDSLYAENNNLIQLKKKARREQLRKNSVNSGKEASWEKR